MLSLDCREYIHSIEPHKSFLVGFQKSSIDFEAHVFDKWIDVTDVKDVTNVYIIHCTKACQQKRLNRFRSIYLFTVKMLMLVNMLSEYS